MTPERAPAPATRSPSGPLAPRIVHWLGLLVVLVTAAVAFAGMQPPAARAVDAPPEAFAAARAMVHVRELCRAPHPVGSRGHDDVRALIERRLTELGLEPQVQRTAITHKFFGRTSGARVENVVARIKGRGSDHRALLFAAHYDAVPQSPGAGDDGSGTAALLEGARALQSGPPLDRDVIVLFTDGEELGLLGAGAFMQEHPFAKDVVAAFNFDARGSHGSVAMFDTSPDNGALIAALAHVPRLQASSLVSVLARLMPNDTDATIFKKAGVPTMSFAFADGIVHYHRATDSPDELDPRSLQQMGDTMVALARHLGRGPVQAMEAEEVSYFTFFGSALVSFSRATSILGAAAALLLSVLAAAFAVKRRDLTARAIAWGGASALLAFALAVGAGAFALFLAGRVASYDALLVRGGAVATSAIALSTLTCFTIFHLTARRIGASAATLGSLALLSLAGFAVALLAPMASVPLLVTNTACALAALVTAWFVGRATLLRPAVFYVAIAVALTVWLPTLYALTVAAAANAGLVAAAFAAPLNLVVAPLAAAGKRRRLLATLGGLLVVAGLSFGRLAWPLGDAVATGTTLAYGVDADKKQGFFFGTSPHPWMAPALRPEDATKRALPELTLSEATWWVAPSEASGLEGVTVTSHERRKTADGFELRAILAPSKDARCLIATADEQHVDDALSVAGKPVRHLIRFSAEKDQELARRLRLGGSPSGFFFQFCAPGGEPLEVVFHTRSDAEVPLRLLEVRDGLPTVVLKPRPAGQIARDDSDRTVVGRTVRW